MGTHGIFVIEECLWIICSYCFIGHIILGSLFIGFTKRVKLYNLFWIRQAVENLRVTEILFFIYFNNLILLWNKCNSLIWCSGKSKRKKILKSIFGWLQF